jgi:hypothetical protein
MLFVELRELVEICKVCASAYRSCQYMRAGMVTN